MSEHTEQAALFDWAQWQINLGVETLKWLFAVPNGGLRHPKIAKEMKAEGLKAGVPDIMLPQPRGEYSGLFIEMKVGYNKPTAEQTKWLEWLNQVGYYAVVCKGFDEARETIEWYLTLASKNG
jgi:hypothetical protein